MTTVAAASLAFCTVHADDYYDYYFSFILKKSNTKRSVLHFCVSVSQHNLYDGQIFRRKDVLYVQCTLPEPWMRNLNLSWWCSRLEESWCVPRASGGQNIPPGFPGNSRLLFFITRPEKTLPPQPIAVDQHRFCCSGTCPCQSHYTGCSCLQVPLENFFSRRQAYLQVLNWAITFSCSFHPDALNDLPINT